MQVDFRMSAMQLRSQDLGATSAGQGGSVGRSPTEPLWVQGDCAGLSLLADMRRPLGQRSALAGALRRGSGAQQDEAQLLLVRCTHCTSLTT